MVGQFWPFFDAAKQHCIKLPQLKGEYAYNGLYFLQITILIPHTSDKSNFLLFFQTNNTVIIISKYVSCHTLRLWPLCYLNCSKKSERRSDGTLNDFCLFAISMRRFPWWFTVVDVKPRNWQSPCTNNLLKLDGTFDIITALGSSEKNEINSFS